ncbi:NADH:ubiquinone oxidoreductase subunit 5 (subunit L)/multisubunit Na+/H+ antiporter MnhA subunit [Palleronia aestuarii]|uniref:NADH:ubiquinone oxidoreductase subunit 5 (Subunit L)/multisubunit Na+/H+ antiporter MnhA subunit n=1 Tax=Palleronia aestuarii TaxID=568105 RepID=A0A2W7NKD0_9RHOB|nr:proton-conducting transporter membrane subunit [Palleronia aestuarii]PZX11762.1 NADH:ubiquinone oxidoreductase subunit 5 (subunit L)/multisubunit Na+/H+ antiporter MnhA subunit [Palleronia aestuarii]
MIWSLALWPVAAGLALWMLSRGSRRRLTALGLAAMGVTLLLSLVVAATGDTSSMAWSPALTLRFGLSAMTAAVAVLVPLVGLCVILFAGVHEAERGLARLLGLLLIFTGAMELVVIANDLVSLLVGWELMGAISWALIGHRWREAQATPSATYAFVATRAGDLGLFVALFACFAGAGSVDYAALTGLDGPYLALAAFGVLVAAAAKAGQGPFAPWLFRAMDGPTSVSAFLHSSTMVAAGAFLVARLQPSFAHVPGFGGAAMALGLATSLAGGIVALRQDHAKKVLAGSTSAQLGLMFAAVGAGWPGLAILHMIAHAAFKAPLFFAAGLAHERAGTFDLRRMRLGLALPVTGALAVPPALALAGAPPLGGAWTKEEIVTALGHASPWLAAAAIAAGGLSAAYATRFALLAFWPGEADETSRSNWRALAALGTLSFVTVILSGIWLPGPHDGVARLFEIALPSPGPWIERIGTLCALALGVLVGIYLARHPRAGERRDWLGLADLIDNGVIAPFLAAARLSARLDDYVIDGLGSGSRGRGLLAAFVVAARAAATGAARAGEAAMDLIPTGTGRLLGMAGADLRRTQTGLSHHYYVFLVAGVALGGVVLILGAR